MKRKREWTIIKIISALILFAGVLTPVRADVKMCIRDRCMPGLRRFPAFRSGPPAETARDFAG